jgi:hypothetical protein
LTLIKIGLPTSTISTPRRRVLNPPSIAMIKAPYTHKLIPCRSNNGTYNQRQALQVISKSGNSFNQIDNDLSQDPSDNLQIICLSFRQLGRPYFDSGVAEGSFSREDRTGYSGVGSRDGGDDRLKSGLSLEGGYVRVLQGGDWSGLDMSLILSWNVRKTYDGGLEVIDYFLNGLPFGKSSGGYGGGNDSLEDREARKERDGESRESHVVMV